MTQDTVSEIAKRVQLKTESAEHVVQTALTRIHERNEELGAFIQVSETALQEARAVDDRVSMGVPVGPLSGVPIAVKDLIDTENLQTTYGGRHRYADRRHTDATVVQRLRDAGAIVIGKTNLHEYAFGTTNINPHYGAARNPWDTERMAGGSSGGSSVAVVAELCAAAIGTDTGGSIRIPAALTGHVGLKPTFGLVPTEGVFPLAESLDHVGPMTRTVQDAACLLAVMANDNALASWVRQGGPWTERPDAQRPLRIGIAENFFWDLGEKDVLDCQRDITESLKAMGQTRGWTFRPITVPCMDRVPRAQSIILFAEARAIHQSRFELEPELYGQDVLKRLVQAGEYRAHEYVWAKQVQREFQEAMRAVFGEIDLIMTPTVTIRAPRLSETDLLIDGNSVPVPSILNRCTNPWNLCGIPAMTLPCGRTSEGLPLGWQLAGPWYSERRLFEAAYALEQHWGSKTLSE